MRRITHKTPLFSLAILVYMLGGTLVFSLADPLLPPARNASDATLRSTYPGSWTDLLGSWETDPSQATVVTFTADFQLTVETECATLRGGYLSIIAGHLAVVNLHAAETRCAFDAEAAEPLLIALQSATAYAAFGHRYLQVFSAAGPTFTFRRAPAPQPAEAAL